MRRAKSLFSNLANIKSFAAVLLCSLVLLNGSTARGNYNTNKSSPLCSVLRAMARVYMAYGEYAKAQPQAERALTLAKTKNVSDKELCLCLLDLAYVYDKQGRLSEADRPINKGGRNLMFWWAVMVAVSIAIFAFFSLTPRKFS